MQGGTPVHTAPQADYCSARQAVTKITADMGIPVRVNTPAPGRDNAVDSSTSSRSLRLRRFVSPFLLVLCSSLFCLVLAEIGFRLIIAVAPTTANWSDRPQIYYFQDGAVNVHDYLYSKAKPPGTFRIAVVGDSFTYGEKLQNDDTLPKRLERLLNLNPGSKQKVEVLNFGVPGFSTRREVALAAKAIDIWDSDLIILQVTLNDPELVPKTAADKQRDSTGKLVLDNPIFRYWKSLAFVLERLNNSASHKDYERYFFDLFENPKTAKNFRAGVEEFADAIRKRNRAMFAVIFPLLSHPLDSSYPFSPLHEKIAKILSANQVPFLDLFPAFENIPTDRLIVEPGKDRHPNEIALRIAAESLLTALQSARVIPEETIPKHTAPNKAPHSRLAKGRAFD